MRPTRLIAAALSAAALAGPAAPGAVAHTDRHAATAQDASPLIPQPPTWPRHPQPVTQPVATDGGRPIPPPPTWPRHPRPIAPPRTVDQLGVVASRPASGFDWGSAGIGAGATLAAFAVTLAGAVLLRRRHPARVHL